GPEPAELRQAAVAGLSRGPEARGPVGRQRTAAAAATGGRAGHERAVFGGVQADYGSHSGAGMRLAPEGWPFILPGWVLVVLGAWVARGSPWVWVPEVVLFLLAVWLLVFFRDPSRSGPRGEQYVIAPADGKIVDVQVVDEPLYLRTRATRISIFMSVFDVHVNRYPATGTVELVRYNPGRFLHAASDKASLENEQASVGLRGARGPLLVRQIAGLIARRIVTDGTAGARAMQGARMGMIRFGSRVDVFVPAAARSTVRVAVGDRVQAGEWGHWAYSANTVAPACTRSPTATLTVDRAAAGTNTSTREPNRIMPIRAPCIARAPAAPSVTIRRAISPAIWRTSSGPRAPRSPTDACSFSRLALSDAACRNRPGL